MAFQTGRIQIDGSLNVDGSIYQWNQLFTGSGGGGTGDVTWASGNVGSDTQIITANGDGSIVAESGLTFTGSNISVPTGLVTGGATGEKYIKLGNNRTDSNYSFVDLIGDTSYNTYGLRVIRNNSGQNTSSEIIHRGTGPLRFKTNEAGDIELYTSNVLRMTVDSGGDIDIENKLNVAQGANIDTDSNSSPLQISRTGSTTDQVLNVGITDTQAIFKYIEDTSNEGVGNFGEYLFALAGNSGETDLDILQLTKSKSYIRTPLDVSGNIQIDGSLNVDGSIYLWNQLFTGGGGATVLNDLTDVSLNSPANSNIMQYNAAAGKWLIGRTPPFRHLNFLSPYSFPFVDGTYDVSINTTVYATYIDVEVKIIPNGSYTIYFENGITRNVITNIIQSQNIDTNISNKGYIFDVYANTGLSNGSSVYSDPQTQEYPNDRFVLASLKYDDSGNLLEAINWSKIYNPQSTSTVSFGDVTWASGNVGSNNQLITANGDGSIVAESGLTYSGSSFSTGADFTAGNYKTTQITNIPSYTGDPSWGAAVFERLSTNTSFYDFRVVRVSTNPLINGYSDAYDTGIAYHASDTFGVMNIKYGSPKVAFGGGNGLDLSWARLGALVDVSLSVANRIPYFLNSLGELTSSEDLTFNGSSFSLLGGLTFDGNVLEFDSAANKTIRMKNIASPDSTPQSLSILGAKGNGQFFTGYTPFTSPVTGYKAYDGGDVTVKGGEGADATSGPWYWGGSGGDLILSGGDKGFGSGGPYGNVYVANGVEGAVSISGSVITADTADFDLGNGSGTDTVDFRHAGDTDTKIEFSGNTIRLFAATDSYEKLTVNSTGVVINEDSQDYDFRVESNNIVDLLEVDAGTDKLQSEGNVVQSCVDSSVFFDMEDTSSEHTILSGSNISNDDYERSLNKKIFRAKFRYRRTSPGNNTVTIRVKLGSTTLDTYAWTSTIAEQGEIEILFGATTSTTSTVSWKRSSNTGTSSDVYFDYQDTVSHGTGSGITITAQVSTSTHTFYVYGATLEQLDSV